MPDRPVDQSFLAPEFFFATLAQECAQEWKLGKWHSKAKRSICSRLVAV